ncbi:MAG: hypothetical protein KBT03_00355 [Bacteroidales bacterium]|nr:hypothetical protein [Candidatus Scybalousia scybalohippi]
MYNIFCITSEKEVFLTEDTPTTLAKALKNCQKYNSIWSATKGSEETRLKCILGYCIFEKDSLSYNQAMKLFKSV